jgi:predicted transcriptional regulator of viral defense system
MRGNEPRGSAKTLGSASGDVLLRLSEQGKTIFSVSDAQRIYRKSRKVTANLLGKLVEKGWLVRLMRGKYLIVPLEAGLEAIPMADRYVIAREVLDPLPYYISHHSAMEMHQMTTQPVSTVYVTVRNRRTSRAIAGVPYRFVTASRESFWGWESVWATAQDQVRVSDLEKTLLDCAARPDLCGGIGELAKGLWLRRDGLDEERLVKYAERLGHKAAARRVGFLLHTYQLGSEETTAALRSLTTTGFDPLDPTLADEGQYDAEWRLRVNVDPEELRASVWT